MIVNAEGIVLRQRKIANNRRMIVIFTRQYGKISAGTSLSERGRSKSALALRPFACSEYELFKGRESYSINSASVKKSFYSIGENVDRFMTASSFIEYLDKVLEDEVSMPGLYNLSLEFMESVSRAGLTSETLFFAYIVKSFRFLGVMPELDCCVFCGKQAGEQKASFGSMFSVTDGGIVCEECANKGKTEAGALIYSPSFDIIDVLKYFISRPLVSFEKINLKPEAADTIRHILADYTSRYLGVDAIGSSVEMEG